MFIDTHCHLDDPKLVDNLDSVVNEYLKEKVTKTITMGCEVSTSILCKDISEKYASVYFGAGIHPMDAFKATPEDLDEIIKLTSHPKCVCVGEIGIDLYWDKTYLDKQIEYLYKLIEIANAVKLPISLHMRNATSETLKVLYNSKSNLTYGGVVHCYNGSKETLKEILKLGLAIGFGGTLTFKNARNLLEIASLVPEDMMVTETDCPYLAPEPKRGTINEPKNIPYITAKLAEIRGIDVEKCASLVYANASRIFYKINEK